jgi:putative hydrolase of the HAD superfamily
MAPYRFDVVFLDAGGVLVQPDPTQIVGRFGEAGLEADEDDLFEAHFRAVKAMDEVPADEDGYVAYHRTYVDVLGLTGREAERGIAVLSDVWATSSVWIAPLPWAASGLTALAATGLPIVIVSNADGTVAEMLASSAVCQVGDGDGTRITHVIDSTAVGVAKPDPRIFELALEVVGVSPERAVHVGDAYRFDVLGARAANVHPVLMDPLDIRRDVDCTRIGSLDHLVDVLAS